MMQIWTSIAVAWLYSSQAAAFSPSSAVSKNRIFRSEHDSATSKNSQHLPVSLVTDTTRKSTFRTSASSPTKLYFNPMDEAPSPGGDVGKVMMLAGTAVEVTRALVMGTISEARWLDSIMHSLTTSGATDAGNLSDMPFFIQVLILWTPFMASSGLVWQNLSNPPKDYRNDMEPYARGEYDPDKADAYYKKHPILVAQRLAELLRHSWSFLVAMFFDKLTGQTIKNRKVRAQELLELVTQLGPTAVKVGQVLSIRPDLIPEEFSDALATLQDQVPPFTCSEAKQILLQELGPEKFSRLEGIENKPVASASIGQVYRVKLDGKDVAVKVQRPNVLSEIALDLYLARELAPIYKLITGASSDLKLLANEWGRGFIAELDYRREAANTIKFNHDMKVRKLDAVTAPQVVTRYSTERVLVTEWVEGTRIDLSEADDIPRLCSVALNAYLVMLLELNSLHCDPHPGNLLRTKDGKLCILDFGMTLEVDPNLQYSLLEYVAHLTSDDYESLPEDLTKLGFLAPDKLEFAKRSGVLEPLKYFLKQVGQGGGAQRFRDRIMAEYREKYPGMGDDELRDAMRSEMQQHIQSVANNESVTTGLTMEVEELQRQNRDSFRIPEWFLYTSRAFLTLEGVSLKADSNYSLIKSCFPYVAKRLVGDDDPRARGALRDMLYGSGEHVDPKRVSDFIEGFSSYTATTKTVSNVGYAVEQGVRLASDGTVSLPKKGKTEKLQEMQGAVTLAKDSADILLAPKGNLVQNMLVEESVLVASARFKDDLKKAVVDGPERLRGAMPFGVGKILPPLPFENHFKRQLEPFIRKTSSETNAQELAEKMMKLVPQSAPSDPNNPVDPSRMLVSTLREMEPEQAALLLKELRENVPKYAPLVGKLGSKFASTLLHTASSNIDTTLQELEQAGQRTDGMLRATARGLSDVAQRGASAFGGGLTPDFAKKKQPTDIPQIIPVDLGLNNSTIF